MKKSMMKAKVSGSSETSVSGWTRKSDNEAGNVCQPHKTAWKDTQEGRKPLGTSRETTKVVKTAKAVKLAKLDIQNLRITQPSEPEWGESENKKYPIRYADVHCDINGEWHEFGIAIFKNPEWKKDNADMEEQFRCVVIRDVNYENPLFDIFETLGFDS